MKAFLTLLFSLFVTICIAQHKVKVYYEQIEDGYHIYADNEEVCVMSVKMEFKVTNLEIEGATKNIYVIEANKSKQLLATLKIAKKGKASKLSYSSTINYGDDTLVNYDSNYAYDLPYTNSTSFKVDQGYNGTFSHQNENSLDFSMPVGTEITAIREGIVVNVVEKNNIHCASKDCMKYNNKILIWHSDGTFAEYAHIKRMGAIVNVGDKVIKGQVIALSGNVGWSTAPHLHLVVFLQKIDKRVTLKTKFKIGSGDALEYLEEKNTYLKNY